MPALVKLGKQFEELLTGLLTFRDSEGVRVFENYELNNVVHEMRTVLRTAEDRVPESRTDWRYRLGQWLIKFGRWVGE